MTDRKSRSVSFKVPYYLSLRELKEGIDRVIESRIVVFQELGASEYLLELFTRDDVDRLLEDGIEVGKVHISCHPLNVRVTNVSILGLKSYVHDDDVKEALAQYGEVQGEIIRLKYKAEHELAGLENGNRLVKMHLADKSIPYSLRIDGEWCRVIHNNQQPMCSECKELGHTRKRCPEIVCKICKEKGHMSYVCERRYQPEEEHQVDPASDHQPPIP